MLGFTDHLYKIDEAFSIRKMFKGFLSLLKKAVGKLNFGKKVSIKLTPYVVVKEDTVDMKSRMGYLAEYSTAWYLSQQLEQKKLRITPRTASSSTGATYKSKISDIKRLGGDAKELQRMDEAGRAMASQIMLDIAQHTEDTMLLVFDLEMTGDSGKGKTKADLILNITKDDKSTIVDRVMASLKAYKTSNINLSNSTFVSFIKTLFYDDPSSLPRDTLEFIIQFGKDFRGSQEDMNNLYDLQTIIGSGIKGGMSKAEARKAAKTTHGDVIEVMCRIFDRHYKRNKAEIDARMLKMIGFDGDDDFYAAVGVPGKMGVISSRASVELKKLMIEIHKGFDLSMKRNGQTSNALVEFLSPDGTKLVSASVTFADTGGKYPSGKTNFWFNYKEFVNKIDDRG